MTRKFAPDSTSFPTHAAAETHGIEMRYAYLLGDMTLTILALGGIGPGGNWPRHHLWHQWAVGEAEAQHGTAAVEAFTKAMIDFYHAKYAPGRRAGH